MKTTQAARAAARLEQISNNESAASCAFRALDDAALETHNLGNVYGDLANMVKSLPTSAKKSLENKLASIAGQAVRAAIAAQVKAERLTKQALWLETFLSKADYERFAGELGLTVEGAVKAAKKWWQSSGIIAGNKAVATLHTLALGRVEVGVSLSTVTLVERKGKEVLIADVYALTEKAGEVRLEKMELNPGKIRRALTDRLSGKRD